MFKTIIKRVHQIRTTAANTITKRASEVIKDQNGQGMAEYGLIVALIAVVVIIALTLMGQRILVKFNDVNDALS